LIKIVIPRMSEWNINPLFLTCIIVIIIGIVIWLWGKNKPTLEPFILVGDDNIYMPMEPQPPATIKYQIPIHQNQLTDTQLQSIDSDILRNIRVNKVFSQVDELNFYQIYNILKYFKNQSITFSYTPDTNQTIAKPELLPSEKIIELNSGAINNTDLNLFSRIKLELISAFNHAIIKSGYYLPYHKYQFFKIINSNLISENIILNPSGINYTMTLTIAREFKYQQFVLYYDIDLLGNPGGGSGSGDLTIKINKIEIIGLPIPKTIEFHENRKTVKPPEKDLEAAVDAAFETNNDRTRRNDIFRGQVSDSQSFDVQPIGDGKIFQSPETKFIDITERGDMDPTLFDPNSQVAAVESRVMNMARDQQFRNHRCFGLVDGISKQLSDYNDNPIFCTSFHPEIGQNGIWDAPCQVNSDCPFYKANGNYPNEFGKCDKASGKCEMPLGVIPIGYTKYGRLEPVCYNCGMESSDNRCCGVQADMIKAGKVGFKTPDYIFKGDTATRKSYKSDIEAQGLKANPSI